MSLWEPLNERERRANKSVDRLLVILLLLAYVAMVATAITAFIERGR